MSKNLSREDIINSSIKKRLTRFEVNKLLAKEGMKGLDSGEADCYDIVLSSIRTQNPRQQIIGNCLMQGLSKTDVNLALYEAKFRRLTEGESEYYDDVLSRLRYCDKNFINKNKPINNKKPKMQKEEIIKQGIEKEFSVQEVNKQLIDNGYEKLSILEENEYLKNYNEFHNKRQGIIQHAFEDLKTIPEVNKILQNNRLTILSILEEMKYQKEKDRIVQKKRNNLIKECLEEKLEIYQIDIILNKNNFEKLSEQEIEKIQRENLLRHREKSKKVTELSDQFRRLYRTAIKNFHPDKFKTEEEKSRATAIIKEINDAKDKNDYFLLKEIIKQYEKI
ncbi:hypothetical protein IJG14_06225 [bacterium]|nr:hypothetical protein [bacterium]